MRTIALLMTATHGFRRPFTDGSTLLTRFGGETVLAHVCAALRQVADIGQSSMLLPPDAPPALAAECAALGLPVPAYGAAPYTTNLALRLADEAGAEELRRVAAQALLLDPALPRTRRAEHRRTGAAATYTPAPRLAPYVISMAAVRRLISSGAAAYTDEVSLLDRMAAEPQQYLRHCVPLPGPATPAVSNLNYVHAVQEPAFAALWAAAGGRGAAAALDHVAQHAAAFDYFPQWAQVEATSRCNQSCPVCPHPRRAVSADLDAAAFDRVVDGLAWAPEYAGIDLAGFGEPLLHPGLRGFIERATARMLEVYLYTNGTQWDRGWSEFVLDPARQRTVGGLRGVIFTINAATRDAYRAFHGTDDYARVRQAVRELLQLKRERGVRRPVVAVQFVKAQATDAQVEAFWQEWNFAERFERQRWPDYDHTVAQGELRLQQMQYERAGDAAAEAQRAAAQAAHEQRYWDAFYRHAELPLEHTVIQRCNDYAGQLPDTRVVDYTPLQRFACRQATFGLMVLADGTVTPCQQDFNGTMAAGSLRDRDLVALWNAAPFAALRRAQREGRYDTTPLCAACRDWFIPMV